MDFPALIPFPSPSTSTLTGGRTQDLPWFELPIGQARIFPHGAHVAQWNDPSGAPLLFMSEDSNFKPGKAIRGGVPVIFPWFGPHAAAASLPAHGFARTSEWQLVAAGEEAGAAWIQFALNSSEASRQYWPFDFTARYGVISRPDELHLSLQIEHKNPNPIEFEAVLHTYFHISDVRQISILGFEDTNFLDQLTSKNEVQSGAIQFTAETDRIYSGTSGQFVIEDPGLKRKILIHTDAPSAVVWNPWIDKSQRLADLGDDEWPYMVCLESGYIRGEKAVLAPGELFELRVAYSLTGLDS
jgi:glucose-6-phosphate 1-epimerase